jgi:oligopeptidase B
MFNVDVRRSRSRAYVFLDSESHTTSEVRYLRADRPEGDWTLVAERVADNEYTVADHGDQFYIRTNDAGRNFRM